MRGIVKSEPVDVKLEPIETDVDLQGLTLVADDESKVNVKEEHPAVQPKTAAEWGDIPVINNGTNNKGSKWCKHIGTTDDVYHYLNIDGSIFFKNPDQSSYYYSPTKGFSEYTFPLVPGQDTQSMTWKNEGSNVDEERERFCFRCEELDVNAQDVFIPVHPVGNLIPGPHFGSRRVRD